MGWQILMGEVCDGVETIPSKKIVLVVSVSARVEHSSMSLSGRQNKAGKCEEAKERITGSIQVDLGLKHEKFPWFSTGRFHTGGMNVGTGAHKGFLFKALRLMVDAMAV